MGVRHGLKSRLRLPSRLILKTVMIAIAVQVFTFKKKNSLKNHCWPLFFFDHIFKITAVITIMDCYFQFFLYCSEGTLDFDFENLDFRALIYVILIMS